MCSNLCLVFEALPLFLSSLCSAFLHLPSFSLLFDSSLSLFDPPFHCLLFIPSFTFHPSYVASENSHLSPLPFLLSSLSPLPSSPIPSSSSTIITTLPSSSPTSSMVSDEWKRNDHLHSKVKMAVDFLHLTLPNRASRSHQPTQLFPPLLYPPH